jgi:hypothetical protein
MKEINITCDSCKEKLNSTTNCVDYRLTLSSDFIPCKTGFLTSLNRYPSITREHHFCDLKCLEKWLKTDNIK